MPSRSRKLLAAVSVFCLFGVALPMTLASADPTPDPADNTLRLAMLNGAGTFTYQDADPATPNLVQSFSASKQCAPVFPQDTPGLVALSAPGPETGTGTVGFATHSLGVKVPGEGNSGKCEQVNVPNQKLGLAIGSDPALAGKSFDFAELDVEAKFDAAINIRIFNDGTQVDASPSDASTLDLVITCTTSGSDCGPDDAARDNFRTRVPSGEGSLVKFDEIWLWATSSNTAGAVSLEGGGDQTAPGTLGSAIGTKDSIFHVAPTPALSVTKLADDGNDDDLTPSANESVTAGDPVGFTVTVANAAGSATATGVSLTDTLPVIDTSWSIESQTAPACSITGSTLSCPIGDLAANASYSVHVTAPTTTETIAHTPIENTASVTATNGGSTPLTATASVDVWSGVIDCLDDPDTTDVVENEATATDPELADITVTRHANIDGAPCTPKNYLISTAQEAVAGEGEVNVVTFLEDLESSQDAHYTMQVDWTYERRDPVDDPDANPATVGGRTFYIDYDGSGTFVPAELCPVVSYDVDGDPVAAMHPSGLPWCITGQSFTIDEDGIVVLQQDWDGLGDPRSY